MFLTALIAVLVPALADAQPAASLGRQAGAGLLAVVGADGNLRIFDGQGENPFALVSDARLGGRIYAWPTWSTDGRLAYFASSLLPADGYTLRVFIQRHVTPGAQAHVAFSALGETFTYAYWAPGDCTGKDCRDLALLYSPATGGDLGLRLLRNEGETTSEWATERGAPFYYSFSPDGGRMIWHRFETQLEYYDVEARSIEGLDDRPGSFAAPMWSPRGERVLFAVRGAQAGRSDVIVAQGERRTPLLRDRAAPVSFAFSPDGAQAAVLDGDGVLTVLDVATGETLASRSSGIILAFFWSPQSDRLVTIALPRRNDRSANLRQTSEPETKGAAQNVPGLSVNLFNPAAQTSDLLGTYIPTRDMIYYLQFYDQFSRSHSLWSPDGRYFAYGALSTRNGSSVVLFDMATPGLTKTIPDSTVGIWSWN
jgi:Tol biopolymer transport system component